MHRPTEHLCRSAQELAPAHLRQKEHYADMTAEEQAVIHDFQGVDSYEKTIVRPLHAHFFRAAPSWRCPECHEHHTKGAPL